MVGKNFYYKQTLVLNAVKKKLMDKKVFTGNAEMLFLKASLSPNPETFFEFLGCAANLVQDAGKLSGLPVPAADAIAGRSHIGFTETGSPVGLDITDGSGWLLAGSPGYGKTITMITIAAQLMRHGFANITYFSLARDALVLLFISRAIAVLFPEGNVKVNMTKSYGEKSLLFEECLTSYHYLFDGTFNFFLNRRKELLRAGTKEYSIRDLLHHIYESSFPAGSQDRDYKNRAINRLSGILESPLSGIVNSRIDHFEKLVQMHSIVLLDSIDSRNNDVFIAYWILRLIEYKKANPELVKVCNVIFIDDATGLFRKELEHRPDGRYSPLALILDTARKYNIILVVSIHNPSLVMESLHNECRVKILFKMNDAEQTAIMARKMGVTREQIDTCFWLSDMSRIISMRGMKPFMYYGLPLNKIPDWQRISNDMLKKNNANLLNLPTEEQNPESEPVEIEKEPVDKEEKKFLFMVYQHQFKAHLTDIANFMMVKASAVSRFVESLKLKGLIQTVQISIKKARYTFPLMTEKGYKELGLEPETPKTRGGGIEHIIFVHMIAGKFEKNENLQVDIEYHLGDNHHADIAIQPKDQYQPIVIEVSVTSSADDELSNVNKALKLGAVVVIVACKDKKVRDKLAGMTEGRKEVVVCMISDLLDCKKDPRELIKLL